MVLAVALALGLVLVLVLEIVVFVVVAVEAFTKYWYFGSKLCAIIFNKFR